MNGKKSMVSIPLKYIDEKLWNDLSRIVEAKGIKLKTKSAVINYILEDYVNMIDMGIANNPYLIEHVRSIIEASTKSMEKNLGGRLTKLIMEDAIQVGIMNRVLMEYFTKFDPDEETEQKLNHYRQLAVEDLRLKKKPLSFSDIMKEEEDNG